VQAYSLPLGPSRRDSASYVTVTDKLRIKVTGDVEFTVGL
jgi:hypothetical protein